MIVPASESDVDFSIRSTIQGLCNKLMVEHIVVFLLLFSSLSNSVIIKLRMTIIHE